jgi:TRAP-type C4-dicarboxylate transport system permease small subunit
MSELRALDRTPDRALDVIGEPERQKSAPDTALGLWLERICTAVAMLGGVILVGIVAVSGASVIGRSLPPLFAALGLASPVKGIPGDIEIVQLGCAVSVFFYLPLCQLKRSNVLVGVFTKSLRPRYRALFDLAANLLFLVLATMLALQLGYDTADKFRDRDTTMVLRIPEGWAYAAALAGLWLLVLVTAYTVLRSTLEIVQDRAIGPPPSGEH